MIQRYNVETALSDFGNDHGLKRIKKSDNGEYVKWEDVAPLLAPTTHKISAVYYPSTNEIELTWENIETTEKAYLITKVSDIEGKSISKVVGPCIYWKATIESRNKKCPEGYSCPKYCNGRCGYCGHAFGTSDSVHVCLKHGKVINPQNTDKNCEDFICIKLGRFKID